MARVGYKSPSVFHQKYDSDKSLTSVYFQAVDATYGLYFFAKNHNL